MALKAYLKSFEWNIIKNYKNLIRIKKIKVWTTKIDVQWCSKKREKKKIMLQIESDWVWKHYTKLRSNSVRSHQNRINLVFLRSKSMCEENVFPKGGEGPCKIINVKEP